MKQIWLLQQSFAAISKKFHDFLGISPVVAEILTQRGFRCPEEAVDFLHPTLLNLFSPFCFQEMSKAVERLSLALKQKEKVLVYGDYDVDGVTSTALLYKVLRDLGFQAVAYIPNRQDEGYGLHEEAIERAAQAGVKVLISVDCGITAVSEVDYAQNLGIDSIITDHHEPPAVLPKAWAILNPKVESSGYPFADLAGVGVAFKLAQALLYSLESKETNIYSELELLDFVALGTIADLVPLVEENRIFVYYGLLQMERTVHLGLEALLKECGLENKPLKAGQIGFMLAPRINAVGRMESARTGLELLLTENSERAEELARLLSQENKERQKIEKEILAEAVLLIENKPIPRVIVLSSDHWHQGVIGIVASRLVEKYFRPVFLMTEQGSEAKGSARGIPGYPVIDQLTTQAHLLTKFGGHKQAAGFSLPIENIKLLREGLNEQALAFQDDLFQEYLKVDRRISLEAISENLLHELEQMAPFGFGNPGPVLACQGIPVYSVNAVGKEGTHIKFRFGVQGEREGIAFRLGERLNELDSVQKLDVAFSLDWNTYRGRKTVQLIIKDVQADAEWREDPLLSENSQSWSEISAALEDPKIEWLDWRNLKRTSFSLNNIENKIWVWDTTGEKEKHHLIEWDFSEDREVVLEKTSVDMLLAKSRVQLLKGTRDLNNLQVQRESLGIILGLPVTEEDFKEGLAVLSQLGVDHIALAEFQSIPEETTRRRCEFLNREELVSIYRKLAGRSKKSNPFWWKYSPDSPYNEKIALKIFEELGLIRCIGGVEKIAVEWIPAHHKLKLESSLRYRSSKERFERALEFQRKMLVPNYGIVYNYFLEAT